MKNLFGQEERGDCDDKSDWPRAQRTNLTGEDFYDRSDITSPLLIGYFIIVAKELNQKKISPFFFLKTYLCLRV